MEQSSQFSKRILLAVSGMSPQIVTETLYAMAVIQQEPPTEIHLISTNAVKQKADLELLHPDSGKFFQLCQDYKLEGIQFTTDHIYVISDKHGVLLDDIKTPEENEAAADFITQKVNELTRDDDCALYVSIAGGRKTMGYYLGYALSLYGRTQDRLSHVLVTERYENLHDFFYPTPDSRVIYDRDKNPLDTKAAQILLANIPFVRLRSGIPHFLLKGTASFNDSIRFARTAESDPLLEINANTLCANGIAVPLSGVNFVFYLWMIQQTVFTQGSIKRLNEPNKDYAQSFLAIYQAVLGDIRDEDKTVKAISAGIESQWIAERRSAVKKAFEKVLGESVAKLFLIHTLGKNNQRCYSLSLLPQQIIGFKVGNG